MIVNICVEMQSGIEKLSKSKEQVIADTDNEIKLLREVFDANLKKQNQDLVTENSVLNEEISYLKCLMIQTNNDRMAFNEIGK